MTRNFVFDEEHKIWNKCKICGEEFRVAIDEGDNPCYSWDFRLQYCSSECRKIGQRNSKRERMRRYRRRLKSTETTYASTDRVNKV